MIARPLERTAPPPQPGPRTGSRAGRAAVQRRRGYRLRVRYRPLATIGITVTVLTVIVVAYLALLANVMRMNFELAKANDVRSSLSDESQRLDDRIAQLESRDRLSLLAVALGMRDIASFAEIPQPLPPAPKPVGPAILSWLK
jgi:hypothetical protein